MNKNQARAWAQTASRAERENMLLSEFGVPPNPALTEDQVRDMLVARINNASWRWRSTYTPPGWTPPAQPTNYGSAVIWVIGSVAGVILIILAGFLLWNLIEEIDDDDDNGDVTVQRRSLDAIASDVRAGRITVTQGIEEARRADYSNADIDKAIQAQVQVPPAATPTPSGQPTQVPTQQSTPRTGGGTSIPTSTGDNNHENRLAAIDQVYWTNGLEAWLKAAGNMTWGSIGKRAEEPEQETFGPPQRTYVAAYQVKTTDLAVQWPACFTTDHPVANYGSKYQPDPTKPSFLYTNVTSFTGNSTLYADCNAGEGLNLLGKNAIGGTNPPPPGFTGKVSTGSGNTGGSVSTITTIEDVKKLGTVIQDLGTGVQIRLTQNVSNLTGFVIQRDNQNVTSARAGELVTIWKQ